MIGYIVLVLRVVQHHGPRERAGYDGASHPLVELAVILFCVRTYYNIEQKMRESVRRFLCFPLQLAHPLLIARGI